MSACCAAVGHRCAFFTLERGVLVSDKARAVLETCVFERLPRGALLCPDQGAGRFAPLPRTSSALATAPKDFSPNQVPGRCGAQCSIHPVQTWTLGQARTVDRHGLRGRFTWSQGAGADTDSLQGQVHVVGRGRCNRPVGYGPRETRRPDQNQRWASEVLGSLTLRAGSDSTDGGGREGARVHLGGQAGCKAV